MSHWPVHQDCGRPPPLVTEHRPRSEGVELRSVGEPAISLSNLLAEVVLKTASRPHGREPKWFAECQELLLSGHTILDQTSALDRKLGLAVNSI
ncbi:hypothetical protein GCM10009813_33260 [Brevibacterium marinum]